VSVPSMRPPLFPVDPTCTVEPLNVLPSLKREWERFVVIGAGKTGMDAVLELLRQRVDPERITWVVSRDPWVMMRDNLWPARILETLAEQGRAIVRSRNWRDLFGGFEDIGLLARIWPEREPECFRCATVSGEEVAQLRRVQSVVRMGHLQRIEAERIVLERGELPTGPHVLHVDCTAQGLPTWAPRPIFEPNRITLQSVLFCQPTASAALVAAAEIGLSSDETRNAALQSTLPPERPEDLLTVLPTLYDNGRACMRHGALRRFFFRNRLALTSHMSGWQVFVAILRALWWLPQVESNVRRIAASMPPRALQAPGTRIN
ncbi:MAG TPA: hypothetical protein DFR83_10545, partial [Deltaproteobacteria bacterium]|nr:hypothetical protein [Deltaproteobacteria bacterium]